MSSKGPRYPNQQLMAVGLETFFRGRFSAQVNLPLVQKEFAERLPDLYVPNAKPGQAIALQPSQLCDEEQSRTLAIATNQASYVCKSAYPGFAAFSVEAIATLTKTLELLEIPVLQRVGYRYENEIGISRDEDELLPIDRVLSVKGLPDWCGGGRCNEVDLQFRRPWEGGSTGVRIAVENEKRDGREVLRITIVAICDPAGGVAQLRRFADAAHQEAYATFEGMITDDFREFLQQERGETF